MEIGGNGDVVEHLPSRDPRVKREAKIIGGPWRLSTEKSHDAAQEPKGIDKQEQKKLGTALPISIDPASAPFKGSKATEHHTVAEMRSNTPAALRKIGVRAFIAYRSFVLSPTISAMSMWTFSSRARR
jgi:hypothetical protein